MIIFYVINKNFVLLYVTRFSKKLAILNHTCSYAARSPNSMGGEQQSQEVQKGPCAMCGVKQPQKSYL